MKFSKTQISMITAAAILGYTGFAHAAVSGLQIPPGQTFLLGGEQVLPLKVYACNRGDTAIDIKAKIGQEERLIAQVKPSECARHTFATGETVALTNLSDSQTGRMRVEFDAPVTSLSMRYIGKGLTD